MRLDLIISYQLYSKSKMKIMNPRSSYSFIIICLLTFNIVFMIFNLITKTKTTNQYSAFIDSEAENSNKLSLNLNIMDIYRLDISCNYITKDLGQKVSTAYKNKHKKCSFSSLNSNTNKMVLESVNQSSLNTYIPIFDLKSTPDYDPFNAEAGQLGEHYLQFKELKTGGIWMPELSVPKNVCDHANLDHIVFIVPFSQSRLNNLKLFLINMHWYLQTVEFKFNYRIIVVEQDMKKTSLFNKGRLINRAVKYALDNIKQIDCLVLHDVDLVPSEDSVQLIQQGDYRCRQMPFHMTNQVYLNSKKESRVYNSFLTGGILSLRPAHFLVSNGFR